MEEKIDLHKLISEVPKFPETKSEPGYQYY